MCMCVYVRMLCVFVCTMKVHQKPQDATVNVQVVPYDNRSRGVNHSTTDSSGGPLLMGHRFWWGTAFDGAPSTMLA